MNDPRTRQPAHALQAAEKLDEIAELADALGIELPILDDVRERVAAARRFVEELRGASEDSSALTTRIGRGLATGELDLESAAAAIIRAQPTPILKTAVRRSEEIAARTAFREAASSFPAEEVFGRCQTIATEAVEEVRKLRKPLNGIRSGEQATEAGKAKAAAWIAFKDAARRFEQAHELVAQLRDLAWLPPVPRDGQPLASTRYARADLAWADKRKAREASESILELLDPITDRWGPGFYSPQEVEEFRREVEEEYKAEDRAVESVDDPVARHFRRKAAVEGV